MRKRTNSLDCVDMKDRLQKHLMVEYESNRESYESLVDFINKKAIESDLLPLIKSKLKQTRRAA